MDTCQFEGDGVTGGRRGREEVWEFLGCVLKERRGCVPGFSLVRECFDFFPDCLECRIKV